MNLFRPQAYLTTPPLVQATLFIDQSNAFFHGMNFRREIEFRPNEG